MQPASVVLAGKDMAGGEVAVRAERIGAAESLYLDLVRAAAAFLVVLDHVPARFDTHLPHLGHEAVIVFFVISGYVISNTVDVREHTARAYLTARLARLWSVLVPALVLTVLCDVVGRHFGLHPEVYATIPADYWAIRLIASLTFFGESWISIQPFSNGVVWSLFCEYWYYILFAAWTFIPVPLFRGLVLVAVAALAGHKALLLLPIWVTGVALQRWHVLRRLDRTGAIMAFVGGGAVTALLAVFAYDPAIALMKSLAPPFLFKNLAQVRVFWLDWLLALAVAAHLLGARKLAIHLRLERFGPAIRWCAGISFATYLFHHPLYALAAAMLPQNQGLLATILVLAAIAVLGPPAEASKRQWRRGIELLWDRVARVSTTYRQDARLQAARPSD